MNPRRYVVIHAPTGDSLSYDPLTRAAALRKYLSQRSLNSVLLATDDRLARSDSRGYYVLAGTAVRAGPLDDVYEIWRSDDEVSP
jgi:hypothetical protein